MRALPLLMLLVVSCGSEAPSLCEDCGDAGEGDVDGGLDAAVAFDAGPEDACAPIAEECDGIDTDCDDATDEDLSRRCWNACNRGLEYCRDGAWVDCDAAPIPEEICNDVDDDCDHMVDEGFDRNVNPNHCGACNRACDMEHGASFCSLGVCRILSCYDGWADCDEEPVNGCEAQIRDWSIEPSSYCGDCDTVCGDGGTTCVGGRCVRP